MSRMKAWAGRIVMALALVLVCGFVRQNASAAAAYQEIFPSGAETITVGDTKTMGDYTFRVNRSYNLDVKKRADAYYTTTSIPAQNAVANDKQVYYVNRSDHALSRYLLASKTTKKEKTLPVSGDRYWNVSTYYANRLYLNRSSESEWKEWTYSYNRNSKKLSKVRDNCDIHACHGRYVAAYRDHVSDVSPNCVSLYRINSATGKFTFVKKLGNHARDPQFVGGKLYYAYYPNYSKTFMKKVILYRCNANGTGRVKLGTLKLKEDYGQVIVRKFGKKSCEVMMGWGSAYRYTYATKKLERLR